MAQTKLNLPVVISDKEIKHITDILNRLHISYSLVNDIWYDQSLLIELDNNELHSAFMSGMIVGKLINKKKL